MSGRVRVSIVMAVAAMLGGIVGFASTPVASSGGDGFAWQTAPDSTLAPLVKSPYTAQCWGGTGLGCENLYNLPQDGYSASATSAVVGALAVAGENAGWAIDPWGLAARITVGAAGSYLLYKAQSEWFSWLDSSWGETSASGITSASWQHVSAGQSIYFHDQSGNTKVWSVPSAGYLLESPPFYGSYGNGSSVAACGYINGHYWKPADFGTGAIDDANCTAAYSQFGNGVTDTGYLIGPGAHLDVWFRPVAAGTAALPLNGVSTSQPAGETQNLNCTGTGYNGLGCTGSTFNNANPSDATVAGALRSVLSEDEMGVASLTVSCVISGDCTSTAFDTSFAMPDCYGLTPDACQTSMNWLGFTGTLQTSIAAGVDYTQPAGVVLSTVPGIGAGVSTLASTIADAYTNPQRCEWDVQNPHESLGSPGLIDVKATDTCTYQTTVTGNLTLWKCDDLPSPDLTQLAQGAWGCVETPGTVVNDSRVTTPDVATVFQVPPPDSGIEITGDGKYFIAYGSVDIGEPSSEFSNVAGPLN